MVKQKEQNLIDKSETRRAFLMEAAAGTALLSGLSLTGCSKVTSPQADLSIEGDTLTGVACFSSQGDQGFQIDLIALHTGEILTSYTGIRASHAIVAVESNHRFFIHGSDGTGQAIVLGIELNPSSWTPTEIFRKQIGGGTFLHWQPNADYSLIQYNSIGDEKLHVLDTHTLDFHTYDGGGSHSNMAFFNDNQWLVATDHLRNSTKLKVVDRNTNTILSETPVGDWAHGVTVNHETKRAFVWANDGVHIVSLDENNIGTHLGVIDSPRPWQRSWFCWTPQGGKYNHDQTWNPGDIYSPWLTVVDCVNDRLEKIETGSEQPRILQVAPDGSIGACGSDYSDNICLFSISSNEFLGTVKAGRNSSSYFDRDIGFSRDRKHIVVTNPGDKTLSIIDFEKQKEIGMVSLPAVPQWMKILTA